jgi:hypothetical protein
MGRIGELLHKAKEHRLGFRMNEEMSGEHEFEPGMGEPGRKAMVFRGTWGPDDVSAWINPKRPEFLTQKIDGRVTIEGLCDDAPFTGTLELRYFGEHKLRYAFEFKAKGKAYRYVGEKVNVRPWNLPVSHTTCFGVVTEAASGKLVSKSVTYFRLSKLPSFLASLRPV